ncbi:aldo/keto reductase [Halosegnis marinus]|uniref:Aldo/keto reductase n=1 Tax=Halosegnis marinus TaxID=3034023 RepID=A0ABD5ZRF6_9EURY|nr:aldo/keto reductase [Halosegnis sp. DT85]
MPGEMPRLGFGTYKHSDRETCIDSVERALALGYRHIDTAQGYENEGYVGEGIARSDVPREDVFLASKLSTENLAYDDVIETTEASLDRLGVDTLDLMYVHWPINTYDPEETLPALDELVDRGLVDNVGVSNFEPRHLAEARDVLDADIFANQVECHALLPQDDLVADARDHDYWLVAYSPIARGEIFDEPAIAETAAKHDASPAQVCLAWLLARDNVAAIPKATGDHIADNYGALDLDLDDEDLARIDAVTDRHRVVDFEEAPWHTTA